jgi:hypothetical protein
MDYRYGIECEITIVHLQRASTHVDYYNPIGAHQVWEAYWPFRGLPTVAITNVFL